MDDPRFSKLFTDPKFRGVPKKERRVKIDDRFRSVFKDKRFVSKTSVDKRGRPGNFSTRENYEKFYELTDDDPDSSDGEEAVDLVKLKEKVGDVDYARGEAFLTDSSSGESSSSDEDEVKPAKKCSKSAVKTTKGRRVSKREKDNFDKWGEMDNDADTTEKATKRLAICNMDWDRVGADDLFLAMTSFCPPGGRVIKVAIFVSDYGKTKLAEDDAIGPAELRKQTCTKDESDEDEVDFEDEKEGMERVRKYQVNRLRYYYAIAEFNSVNSSVRVYNECDGSEYELSATRFDLRFVPEDMDFDEADLKDECDRMPEADKYKAKMFSTTALALGKVDLTWDETDPKRLSVMRKAFDDGDIDDSELNTLVAPVSSDEERVNNDVDDGDVVSGGEDDFIAKYRALLTGANNQDKESEIVDDANSDEEGAMEVTFVPASEVKKASQTKEMEKMAPWDKYLAKKREKRQVKRQKKVKDIDDEGDDDVVPDDVDMNDPFFAEVIDVKKEQDTTKKKSKKKAKGKPTEDAVADKNLSLLVMDSDDDKEHFDYKEIVKRESKSKKAQRQAKRKAQGIGEDSFEVDLGDSRFSAIFDDAEFNVDPSNPSFKKTKSMQRIIEEKQKRILRDDKKSKPDDDEGRSKRPKVSTLTSLANSVKSKSDRMKSSRKKTK